MLRWESILLSLAQFFTATSTPGRRFTPFINAGASYYHLELNGNYYFWGETFTFSGDENYKTLSETISVSDSGVGYTVGAGINWRVLVWHFDLEYWVRCKL